MSTEVRSLQAAGSGACARLTGREATGSFLLIHTRRPAARAARPGSLLRRGSSSEEGALSGRKDDPIRREPLYKIIAHRLVDIGNPFAPFDLLGEVVKASQRVDAGDRPLCFLGPTGTAQRVRKCISCKNAVEFERTADAVLATMRSRSSIPVTGLLASLLAILIVLATAYVWFSRPERPPPDPVTREQGDQQKADDSTAVPAPVLPAGTLAHAGPVTAVAFSPDGKLIASAGWDRAIHLWDSSTRKHDRSLSGHTSAVRCLAFSPDGSTLASGSGDSSGGATLWPAGRQDTSIRLWDVRTGKELHRVEGIRRGGTSVIKMIDKARGHWNAVTTLEFSPDGKTLASGGYDRRVLLWDVPSYEKPRAILVHRGLVRSISFSPDGTQLATASGSATWECEVGMSVSGALQVWDVATGWEVRTIQEGKTRHWAVAFSADGKTIASSIWSEIRLWEAATGNPSGLIHPEKAGIGTLAYSPDGSVLAFGPSENNIVLIDTRTRRELHALHCGSRWITSLAFSKDGKLLAIGEGKPYGGEGRVRLWDVAKGEELLDPK